MRAVVKRFRRPGASVEDVRKPKAGRGEVLARMLMTSICGSDVHIWDWNHWAEGRVSRLPIIFGHEFCGEIVDVGAGVRSLEIGDRVSAETHIVDGTCYQCKTGRMHICRNMKILGVDTNGVFAEFVRLPAMNARKLPPGVDPRLGSLLEPLGNAVLTVLPNSSADDVRDKNVVITGCGPIGLMAIKVARALGAKKIIATELGTEKVRFGLARRMGADVVLDANMGTDALVKEIRNETEGNGTDVALEMSGAAEALRQVFAMLTPGGRVSILGLYNDPVTLDVNNAITFKCATVYGITGRRMFQTWDRMYELLAHKEFRSKISSIITHTLPIRDIEKGMDIIRREKAAKVSLKPEW